MKEMEILGKNVKRYRQFKGLTQEDLATKVGLTKDTISKIELGKQENVGSKHLISISRELNVELEQLVMADPEARSIKFVLSDENVRNLEKLFTEVIRISGKKLDTKRLVRLSLEFD